MLAEISASLHSNLSHLHSNQLNKKIVKVILETNFYKLLLYINLKFRTALGSHELSAIRQRIMTVSYSFAEVNI